MKIWFQGITTPEMLDLVQEPADWSTSLPDWKERIMGGRSIIPKLPLFDPVAEKALRIFKRLHVPDLIGTPTYGEVCDEWVFDFVRAIFGSFDPETKRRAIQEFFLLVPKKNGKSAIAAAIIVTAAILNERPQAELILIAPTQKIAGIAFTQAANMIKCDPDLNDKTGGVFRIRDHQKTIEHLTTGAEIKILSADADVVTGSKATYILIDETHVLGSKAKAADIFIEIRGGLASRPDGFMLQITTQSKSPPTGQFKKELLRARAQRDGKADHGMLAVLYELPPEVSRKGKWREQETWGLVNPHLERSVSLDYLRRELVKAEADGAEALALFASQHFNVEIGIGIGGWIGSEYWAKCADDEMTLERILETSDVAVMGVDAGGADDLFSVCVMGRHAITRNWQPYVKAWCLDIVLTRRQDIAPQLLDFETDGDLVITDSAEAHVIEATELALFVKGSGKLPSENAIGMDRYGIDALVDQLLLEGFSDEELCEVQQGFRLNGAIKGLERRLYDGRLRHCNQPLANWCMSNARAEQRGNNVMITKEVAGSGKIDPVMAMFNASVLMSRNPYVDHVNFDDFLADPVMVA